ncbi:hypothetical protein IQ07DRAFT_591172 [Pyrenochaeta sp. DS3sAY3a]|nr:hypothetical protein IQ07DRAFT_591172 [Pyrenochaeta sp. DS3sAY3a]
MTKKRKRYPDLTQKLERPWCFYCERDFDDLKILISHQKAKHFKCDRCGRRLNTAGGLSVHMNQVHKENLTFVENAIAGRQGLDIEIFGMEGVPEEVLEQHNQKVTQDHFAEQQERARLTGNPIQGLYVNGAAQPTKKYKVAEEEEDLDSRAAQFADDRRNGVLPPPPVEAATNPTPPIAHAAYGAPVAFPGAPPAFAGSPALGFPTQPPPFANNGIPGQPGALPPRPGFGAPAFPAPAFHDAALSSSIDDLIGEVTKEQTPVEKNQEKKSKKAANVKLVYFDELLSPEEKMARLPRFADFMQT